MNMNRLQTQAADPAPPQLTPAPPSAPAPIMAAAGVAWSTQSAGRRRAVVPQKWGQGNAPLTGDDFPPLMAAAPPMPKVKAKAKAKAAGRGQGPHYYADGASSRHRQKISAIELDFHVRQ